MKFPNIYGMALNVSNYHGSFPRFTIYSKSVGNNKPFLIEIKLLLTMFNCLILEVRMADRIPAGICKCRVGLTRCNLKD